MRLILVTELADMMPQRPKAATSQAGKMCIPWSADEFGGNCWEIDYSALICTGLETVSDPLVTAGLQEKMQLLASGNRFPYNKVGPLNLNIICLCFLLLLSFFGFVLFLQLGYWCEARFCRQVGIFYANYREPLQSSRNHKQEAPGLQPRIYLFPPSVVAISHLTWQTTLEQCLYDATWKTSIGTDSLLDHASSGH